MFVIDMHISMAADFRLVHVGAVRIANLQHPRPNPDILRIYPALSHNEPRIGLPLLRTPRPRVMATMKANAVGRLGIRSRYENTSPVAEFEGRPDIWVRGWARARARARCFA